MLDTARSDWVKAIRSPVVSYPSVTTTTSSETCGFKLVFMLAVLLVETFLASLRLPPYTGEEPLRGLNWHLHWKTSTPEKHRKVRVSKSGRFKFTLTIHSRLGKTLLK